MARDVVQTIPSACGLFRAEILRRESGGFQVMMFRWTEEVVPGYGKVAEFWEQADRSATLTDTQERAAQLAIEKLRDCGAEIGEP
jgi:hypothetical protein